MSPSLTMQFASLKDEFFPLNWAPSSLEMTTEILTLESSSLLYYHGDLISRFQLWEAACRHHHISPFAGGGNPPI